MQLETERLILRDFRDEDAQDLVEGLNNIDVTKWLSVVPFPYTLENARSFINYCKGESRKEPRINYDFAVILKSESKLIGCVSLNNINYFHRIAPSGGIWFNKNYHGKGYATEAFNKRIEFAFNQLELRKIENGYFKGNESFRKLQLKLGYKEEGIRVQHYRCRSTGNIVDEVITGLLKNDWLKAKLKLGIK